MLLKMLFSNINLIQNGWVTSYVTKVSKKVTLSYNRLLVSRQLTQSFRGVA